MIIRTYNGKLLAALLLATTLSFAPAHAGDASQKDLKFSEQELNNGAKNVIELAKNKLLLQACREFKDEYLTTAFSKSDLEKTDQFLKGGTHKYSQNMSCRGYDQNEIDRLFARSDELAKETDEAEQLETIKQMLKQDPHNDEAVNLITRKCEFLTGDADSQLEYQASYKFNPKTCEFD